jgi:enoyl-CoA hydratase|tara:strand:- start:1205 stop:2014 length:810 start_codon:yes stop_codon:yes gene_type:complete
MSHENIRYEIEDRVATITIDRPERRNAMTYPMNAEYGRLVNEASNDDSVQVLVLTGAGGAFCAGTDLSALEAQEPADRGGGAPDSGDDAPAAEPGRGWWALADCPKPTICAIDGPAVGMGAEFTSHADIRIASTRARISWIFAQRGLVPDTGAGTWLLPRLLGVPRAMELLYTGRFLLADEAKEIGYLQSVVEPDELVKATRELADAILQGSPFAHRLTKGLVYDGLSRSAAEHIPESGKALQACFGSEDHKEGVRAFLEKREARFTGR